MDEAAPETVTATRRAPRASIAFFIAALAIPLIPGAGSTLCLDRAAARQGETWRLLTGHWTHGSADHLLWDALAFLVLSWACERREGALRLCAFLGTSALAISLAVLCGLPALDSYRGLSGIDSALFVWLAAGERTRAARTGEGAHSALWAGALAAFLAKAAREVLHGGTIFVDSEGAGLVPVPLAHLVGAALGAAATLLPPRSRGV
ncbi:MAG: rhombosortase [Planctomycetes bacterium]|nr:rhombosortase [Planctomycetota bacterium]